MKPPQLIRALQALPQDLDICIVVGDSKIAHHIAIPSVETVQDGSKEPWKKDIIVIDESGRTEIF